MSELLRVKIEIAQFDVDGDEINSVSIDLVPPEQNFALYVMRVLHAAALPESFIVAPEPGLR